MPRLSLWTEAGEFSLDVRRFEVREALSSPFVARIQAVSPDPDIPFEALAGHKATFSIESGTTHGPAAGARAYRGYCRSIEQTRSEPAGLSTYELEIVSFLGLLALRRDHRMFQKMSLPDIVRAVLAPYRIDALWQIDPGAHPPVEMRVEHGETDLSFVLRLLEEAQITFFHLGEPDGPTLLFTDAPGASEPSFPPLPFADSPNRAGERPYVTNVSLGRVSEDERGFAWPLVRGPKPVFEARLTYETSVIEAAPGAVIAIWDHPEGAVTAAKWLVADLSISGTVHGEWVFRGRGARADVPYRPSRITPKPRAHGLQSAVVVGPKGEEIFTDGEGRVRVQFRWDRQGNFDERSSPWLRVSHPAAGAGFGTMALPRVGQEVLVGFFEGDPDRPVIFGAAWNGTSAPVLPLPARSPATGYHTRTTPEAGGFNQLVLDDAAAREQIFVRAQLDMETSVGRNETATVGQNRTKLVLGEETETTGRGRYRETLVRRAKLFERDSAIRVEGARESRVLLDQETAAAQAITHIEKEEHILIRKEQRISIDGKLSLTVDGDSQTAVIGRAALSCDSDIEIKSTAEVIFEGLKNVTFACGSSYIVIDSLGVTISGPIVKINSGGQAGEGQGCSPDAPDAPSELPEYDPPMPHDAAAPEGEEAGPLAPAAPPPPPEVGPGLTWIEIRLVDASGEPVRGEKYRVTAPNGKVFEGHTDSDGRAKVEGIVAGMCEVTFPDLDARDIQ